jgi:hypothetical protein
MNVVRIASAPFRIAGKVVTGIAGRLTGRS